jgi:hypothetical protein
MPIFVWTKVGTEAGEPLASILARKEHERVTGGVFWWGIGTSLGPALRDQAQKAGGTLPVLFCEMLGPAQRHDVSPASTVRWARWRDWSGMEADTPSHICVTSRGEDRNDRPKDKHYALLCSSTQPITFNKSRQSFEPRNCRTLSGRVPGDSQNTAPLDGNPANSHLGGRYRVAFTATLIMPWQVTLIR